MKTSIEGRRNRDCVPRPSRGLQILAMIQGEMALTDKDMQVKFGLFGTLEYATKQETIFGIF